MWNDAGCNCDGVRTVLTHDATFEHYARVAAKFAQQCDVEPRPTASEKPKNGESLRRRPTATAMGLGRDRGTSTCRCPNATRTGFEPSARRSRNCPADARSSPRGSPPRVNQAIDCSLLQSAMLALLPCLGQVAETVSDECCKGLNSWNDAGCYCDGVQTIMDDPETPKAYVALAAVLNPRAASGEGYGFKSPDVRAAAPGAAAHAAAAQPAAATARVVHARVRNDLGRSGDVGAFYRSFSPYEWDAPTDEDYCKWMADVLVCDYIKNRDDCEWKDSEAGGEKEVLTPCEWYEGKCELRDYLQIGARELRNAFRNVLAASQSAHDACAAGCDGDDGTMTKSAWRRRTGASPPSTPRWPPPTPPPVRYEPPRFSAWCTASTCTASCGATRAKARVNRSLT